MTTTAMLMAGVRKALDRRWVPGMDATVKPLKAQPWGREPWSTDR